MSVPARTRVMGLLAAAALALAAAGPAAALITPGDPALALVAAGAYSGVGQLIEGRGSAERPGCTATLLATGRHLLTAAHCVTPATAAVRFDTADGPLRATVSERFVHPNLNGDDIAVLELAEVVDARVARHDIYRGSDEVGRVFTKVAYGAVGTGAQGQTGRDFAKRAGENRFEGTFADFLALPGVTEVGRGYLGFVSGDLAAVPQSFLMFDFDSGLAANDAFGLHTGRIDLGQGAREFNTGGGDSGSPAFIDGRIAGVTSFGLSDFLVFASGSVADASVRVAQTLDEAEALLGSGLYQALLDFFTEFGIVDLLGAFNNVLATDSSFGEFSAEARVSAVAVWIDEITGFTVPEPPVLALVALALAAGAAARRRAGRAEC